MPTGNLPAHAKEIFNAAEASALKGACKGDKGCAARIGWAAVKHSYKKSGDEWVAKSESELLVDDKKWEQELVTQKYTKDQAGYHDGDGTSAIKCGNCQHFINGGLCSLVDGPIDPEYYCTFFDQVTSMGDKSAVMARSGFDMIITKASHNIKTGKKRWAAVASDTDLDSFGDRMSIPLFKNFVDRINSGEAAPGPLQSKSWKGGNPYLGISHYLDLDGYGMAGESAAVYIDGNRLKAKGSFTDNEIGRAAYTAVKADIVNDVPYDERIRISIAFVDWEHMHGDKLFTRRSLSDSCDLCAAGVGDKMYTKGQLIHLALTRVPSNKRTPVWVEEKSMTTMREDALSVLKDEDLVNELEKRSNKNRALARKAGVEEIAEGAVIVRDESEVVKAGYYYGGATDLDGAEKYLTDQKKVYEVLDTFGMLNGVLQNILEDESIADRPAAISSVVGQFKDRVDEAVKRSLAVRAAHVVIKSEEEASEMAKEVVTKTETPAPEPAPAPEPEPVPAPLDAAFAQLKTRVKDFDKTAPVENRYQGIQEALGALASVIKAEVEGQVAKTPASGADIEQAVARGVSSALQPIAEQLAMLAAKSSANPTARPNVPAPRATQPSEFLRGASEAKPVSSITKMVRKSVGLRE